jgi:hypothetical protein
MVDALSWMLNLIEENEVLNQTMDITLFFLQPMWLQEIFKYFITLEEKHVLSTTLCD